MSEETVVRQCAPTLAGIKTGTLFPYRFSSRERLAEEIRAYNRCFVPKGLCLIPLRYMEKSALLYLYRPAELKQDLRDGLARELLTAAGYRCDSCGACILRLIQRFRESGEFPHEIGLFLSYPPEDVKGFIENGAVNYKCAGLWKVYGDEQRAQSLFDKFRRCTEIYCRRWREGTDLEQLTVPA